MITPKEIADAFADLEIYLIQSLARNLVKHTKWEKDLGFEWPAWQAEKIRNINTYRRQNKIIAENFFSIISKKTRQMLVEQYTEQTEVDTMNFKINDRRMNALMEEMQKMQDDVKTSALRTMDDAYRKSVSKASIAMQSGTMTLKQAVDSATKDFLNRGINSVVYRDGRHMSIVSYAEMALRTAATRTQLIAQGKEMDELDIDTVICSSYMACSKTCLPWQGKVYIDDIFHSFNGKKGVSYGIASDGESYLLLSYAVKQGLLHPNCRHHLTMYQGGEIPPPLDEKEVKRISDLEVRQRALERNVRRYKRLENGTVDEVKRVEYTKKRKLAQAQLRQFINVNTDVLTRDYWREKTVIPFTKKDENAIISNKIITGARNPYGKAASKHAEQYYTMIRNIKSDIVRISQNTEYSQEEIIGIKKFLFTDKHKLDGEYKYFDADYMIAQSWQRLIDGKNIKAHDLTLLKHEILEKELIATGLNQSQAHLKASEIYNYSKEAELFYVNIEKYKKE
ncbi:MAG: phage minor capsid protein [Oscillospiraceae bacterium]